MPHLQDHDRATTRIQYPDAAPPCLQETPQQDHSLQKSFDGLFSRFKRSSVLNTLPMRVKILTASRLPARAWRRGNANHYRKLGVKNVGNLFVCPSHQKRRHRTLRATTDRLRGRCGIWICGICFGVCRTWPAGGRKSQCSMNAWGWSIVCFKVITQLHQALTHTLWHPTAPAVQTSQTSASVKREAHRTLKSKVLILHQHRKTCWFASQTWIHPWDSATASPLRKKYRVPLLHLRRTKQNSTLRTASNRRLLSKANTKD